MLLPRPQAERTRAPSSGAVASIAHAVAPQRRRRQDAVAGRSSKGPTPRASSLAALMPTIPGARWSSSIGCAGPSGLSGSLRRIDFHFLLLLLVSIGLCKAEMPMTYMYMMKCTTVEHHTRSCG